MDKYAYSGERETFLDCKYIKSNKLNFVKIDKVFPEEEISEFLKTFECLEPDFIEGNDKEKSGAAIDSYGNVLKNNRCFYIYSDKINDVDHQIFAKVHHKYFNTLRYLANNEIVNEDSVFFAGCETNWDSHLISYYARTKDEYKAHKDESMLTLLLWFNHSGKKEYSGGNLILPDHGLEFPCDHNTGIIIPSHTFHKVSPIEMNSITESLYPGRICYTIFTGKSNYKNR